MAGGDPQARETIGVLRAPKISFVGGLSETGFDTDPNFLSGMENMTVENGALRKRKGTRCLNAPGEKVEFKEMHSATISGCKILFGVTTTLELVAFVSEFPERMFYVAKRGFTPLDQSKTANTYSEKDRYCAKFAHGSSFWFAETAAKLRVFNEFGDTFTINKNGFIQFWADIPGPESVDPIESIRTLRNTESSIGYLMVEICRTDLGDIPKLQLIKDNTQPFVPLRGIVRGARVNAEGVIGPLSDPAIVLTDSTRCFASVVDAQLAEAKYETKGVVFGASEEAGSYLYRQGTFPESGNGVFSAGDPEYKLTATPPQQRAGTVATSRWVPFSVTGDSTKGFRTFFWFDYMSLGSVPSEAPQADFGCSMFISVSDIEFLPILGSDYSSAIDGSGHWEETLFSADEQVKKMPAIFEILSVYRGLTVPLTYSWNAGTISIEYDDYTTGDVYEIDLPFPKAGTSTPKMQKAGWDFPSSDGDAYRPWRIGRMKISLVAKAATEADVEQLYFPYSALAYSIPGGAVDAFRNKGFDCWEKQRFKSIRDAFDEISIDKETFEMKTSSTKWDIVCSDSVNLYDWIKNGSRFAVWNNDKIIAISQEAFLLSDETTGDFVYDIETTPDDPRITSRIPQDTIRAYVPFIAMDFQKLRSFGHPDTNTWSSLKSVSLFAVSADSCFLYQAGALWAGKTATMLFDLHTELSFSPLAMREIIGGVVLASAAGFFYANNKLEVYPITRTGGSLSPAKASCAGGGVAFFVTEAEEVIACSIARQTNGDMIPVSQVISDRVSAVKWGASPKMVFSGDSLYIAREDDIYRFCDGRWTRDFYFSARTIRGIFDYCGKLVVSFYDDPVASDTLLETYGDQA